MSKVLICVSLWPPFRLLVYFYNTNSRSRLKHSVRDMDFLLVLIPSSLLQTAVCSHRFVCNVVLCRLGWFVDRVIIIIGHRQTLLDMGQAFRNKKIRCTASSGPGSMLLSSLLSGWLWIRYWCRLNEIRFLFLHIWWLEVLYVHTLVSPVMKPRCVTGDSVNCWCSLYFILSGVTQQVLLLILWTRDNAIFPIYLLMW